MADYDKLNDLIQEFQTNNFSQINNEIFLKIETSREKISKSPVFDYHPQKKSAAELIEKDTTSPAWGRFLYLLIKTFNFKSCLELGTCLGFSGAYILASLNGNGKLISLEGLTDRAQLAKQMWKRLGFNNFKIEIGQFGNILPKILEKNHFDFVFIDGHHKKEATLRYFNMIYPKLLKNAIIVIDDIHWPTEMRPAWKIIQRDIRIVQAHTVDKWGICLMK